MLLVAVLLDLQVAYIIEKVKIHNSHEVNAHLDNFTYYVN